jgi:hypothetical protein
MAYGTFYPQTYCPTLYGNQQIPQNAPQVPQNAPQGSSNNFIWVQGEAAAKAYPVVSGQSVLLMDSENSVFYIKSTDQSGMPQPLRIFDYTEKTSQNQQKTPTPAPKPVSTDDFVSRKEFEAFREDVRKRFITPKQPKGDNNNG